MSTSVRYAGKVVVVTGSSSGIGADTAIQFGKSGAQVVIAGRRAHNLSEVSKQIAKVSPTGLKALEVVCDVTKDDDCKRLIESTIKAFGRLDVLVNNAGVTGITAIDDKNILNDYHRIFDTNVRSIIYLTHLATQYLEKTKGNIINISSIAGLKPVGHLIFQNWTIYCMSKSALDMFTKCLALELGPRGIRVNSVNPAAVRTEIMYTSGGLNKKVVEENYELQAKSYPLGRVADPIDIANVILFLGSDEASFLTGVNLLADGGAMNALIRVSDFKADK
ncbi:unnamed protein product [Medioppia subpectinata]|uniref:Uncharacterized protein n=1 Tax=Medioppia subpectinata TaxID=1979941 RepID=A0A7R9KL05_9ACAR|nr:unnamed protein product [Medioppia subpectinata]CAG2104378.1 unnamed protein product [Medioppia subpectinata]